MALRASVGWRLQIATAPLDLHHISPHCLPALTPVDRRSSVLPRSITVELPPDIEAQVRTIPDLDQRVLSFLRNQVEKHPSTKTASRARGKTKSGFPFIGYFLRQPVIFAARRSATSRSSVVAFPALRMRDMS